jgi:hypothetical protein
MLAARLDASPYFWDSFTELWQGEQTCAETFAGATGEFGSLVLRMLCSPWQSVQTGASAVPLPAATPWTLASYSLAIFA